MKLRIYDPTILAIDLRHRRFGYAVFEGHRLLLDWGERAYRAVGDEEAAIASKRLDVLLKLFSPSAIVLKKERWNRVHGNPHLQPLAQAILQIACNHSVPIHLVGQDGLRETYMKLGCETRENIAITLARIFPELLWSLPPKRKAWEAEHNRMCVFDAIALGFSYWQHPIMQLPCPD